MKKIIFQIALVLIVLALAVVGVIAISRSISSAVTPLKQANSALSTQVTQLLNPTPTILPDPVTIIHEVRSLARLETMQYTVEKIISAESGEGPLGFLYKDKLLLVAHVTVIAGVDLEKLQPEDMWLSGSVLKMRLPEAEIFIAALDNDKTYVYERETSILRAPSTSLETAARQSAEAEIRHAALDDGILELAQQNAESYLTRFLMALGYDEVIFVE